MKLFAPRPQPPNRRRIRLGSYGSGLFPKLLEVDTDTLQVHAHLEGKSGYGKSRFFAALYLSWLASRQASAILIDPHRDLGDLLLARLIAEGFFHHPRAMDRFIYLDVAKAERQGRYLSLNPLIQPLAPHEIAAQLLETAHRAFPELAQGAATFDTLFVDCVLALIAAKQPLTQLERFLLDADFRATCLQTLPAGDTQRFFVTYYNRLRPTEQLHYAGSVIRRAKLLTRYPVLANSLASTQPAVLDWDRIRRTQQHVIINLGGLPAEVRTLLGCLILTGAEQHALSLALLRPQERPGRIILFLDEFHEFVAHSEAALAAMLSQTRKFGLYLYMANQDTTQTSERLRGALSNADLRAVFRLERQDAEHYAGILGSVNPFAVKYEVADSKARDSRAPVFMSINEQWEEHVQRITHLPKQHAIIKLPSGEVVTVRTPSLPDPVVDPKERAAIEQQYIERYFAPPAPPSASSPLPQGPTTPPPAAFQDEEDVTDD